MYFIWLGQGAGAASGAVQTGKVPVFGLLKRQGKVYVAIIANAGSDTLILTIRDKLKPDSVVFTDPFRSYDVLDVSEFHPMRIKHSRLSADQRNHSNGIENFWNQSKRRVRGYNGIPCEHFHLFIKESEFQILKSRYYKRLECWL